MEDLSAVDPKVNSEEKFSTYTHHSYFRSIFSRNNFKVVKVQMQERAKNVKTSRIITFIVVLTTIGIFSMPLILYYALRTVPMPKLNSRFTDVNISTVRMK